MNLPNLKINTSWENSGGARSRELAATWAKVRISAGNTVFTRVLDTRADTVREDVYFPLYPLAEWIACNWFFLLYEVPNPRKQNQREIEKRHDIRAGREGFAFPNISIWSEGETTSIKSKRFTAEAESVEYLAEGYEEVDSEKLRLELTEFIDLVCERLVSKEIYDTLLQEEWYAIQSMDKEERLFSAACARIGQDPFSIKDQDAQKIVDVASQLSDNLQEDFFDAADIKGLTEQLKALKRYLSDIKKNQREVTELKRLRDILTHTCYEKCMPWEEGYEAARSLRDTLNLNGTLLNSKSLLQKAFRLHADEWKSCFLARKIPDSFFDSLVGLNKKQSPVFIVPQRNSEAQRFAFCRAFFEYLTSDGAALTNRSYSCRQKRNRAFAAELLAPSAILKQELGTHFADEETIAALASHFGVSEFVIQHQIKNHQLADPATHIY